MGSPVRARGARRGAAALRPGLFPAGQPGAHRRRHRKLRAPGFTGTLRVCATPSLTMKWLIPRLSGFQALHPGIDVQLTTQGRSFLTGRRRRQRRAAAPWLHGARRAELRALPGRFPCAGGIAALHRAQPAGRAGRLSGPSAAEGRGRWTTGRAGSRWPRSTCPRNCPPVFDHHFLCMQAAMNDLGIALAPWCLLQDETSPPTGCVRCSRSRSCPTPASMRCTVPAGGGGRATIHRLAVRAGDRAVPWRIAQAREILMSEPLRANRARRLSRCSCRPWTPAPLCRLPRHRLRHGLDAGRH